MVPDALLFPLIGGAGVLIGVVITLIIARRQGVTKTDHSPSTQEAEATFVHGEEVDVRELRILRALYGEREGRRLETYKDKYYRHALEATIEKGWVKHVGRRYHLTPKGAEFCQGYLKQLLSEWKPAE